MNKIQWSISLVNFLLPKVLSSVYRVTKGSTGGFQDIFKMHLGILETLGWWEEETLKRGEGFCAPFGYGWQMGDYNCEFLDAIE